LGSLQSALGSLQTSLNNAAKAGGSGGGKGGGSSSAPQSNPGGAGSGNTANTTWTPESTIDALATDGSASDGQVAAYLQALDESDPTLADAIIGDSGPVALEDDPSLQSVIATSDPGDYQIPTVTDDGGGGGSGDGIDSGDDSGDDDE
jgi:hypothetical protein